MMIAVYRSPVEFPSEDHDSGGMHVEPELKRTAKGVIDQDPPASRLSLTSAKNRIAATRSSNR